MQPAVHHTRSLALCVVYVCFDVVGANGHGSGVVMCRSLYAYVHVFASAYVYVFTHMHVYTHIYIMVTLRCAPAVCALRLIYTAPV